MRGGGGFKPPEAEPEVGVKVDEVEVELEVCCELEPVDEDGPGVGFPDLCSAFAETNSRKCQKKKSTN